MSFRELHYCKKCRTCNTLASLQPGVADATSGHESPVGACSGGGDTFSKDEAEDRSTTQQFSQINLPCPPSAQNVSSSDTPNTIQSDSSTPRSDASSNVSDVQKDPPLPTDSLLQYLQREQGANPQATLSHFPLLDRNVVGQEKSPISGMPSGASVSTASSSSHGGPSELVPKERRRWVRPPLIGQTASSTEVKIISDEFQPSEEEDSLLDDSGTKINESEVIDCSGASSEISGLKHEKSKSSSSNESANNSSLSKSIETGDSADENLPQKSFETSVDGEHGIFSDSYVGGKASPSSSVASHKRLEWDSGADVGYQDYHTAAEGSRSSIGKLSAIERLALVKNTDKALRMRLDPEGTSASAPPTRNNPTPTFNTYPPTLQYSIGQPSANSTPIDQTSSLKSQRKSGSIGITPIAMVESSKQTSPLSNPVHEIKNVEELEKITPRQRSSSVSRTRSSSLLNLRTAGTDPSKYLYLFRSQSDPDVSADAGTHTDDSFSLKFSPRKSSKGRGLDAHSLSSGSEKTLVHISAEGRKKDSRNIISDQVSRHEKEQTKLSHLLNTHNLPQTFASTSKGYSCSDHDHRQGLHHHWGILCSSCLVIPSELDPQNPSRQAKNYNPQKSHSSSVNSSRSSTSHSIHSDSGDSGQHRRKDLFQEKAPTQDRTTSVTPPADGMRDGTSAYVGKATSFEYLPGRIYESEMAAMRSNIPIKPEKIQQLSQPPSSDSSSVDSGQNSVKRQVVHHSKHKLVRTSSGDSEDALWSSPRTSSGTLVRDLERGVNLLRGLVLDNAHNTASQREFIRRLVKRLVSSEYTDDLLEREIRRQNRRPLSGGHTYGVRHPTSLSERTDGEQRARSAPHRSSRRAQGSGTSRAPTKTYVETGTQPSDTVSSSATESSSLRSTSENESQKAAMEAISNLRTKRANENYQGTQPASQCSNPASEQPANPASSQPTNPASGQPSNPASEPSNLASEQSNPASNQPSNPAAGQSSNHSSQAGSLSKVSSIVNATTNPVTTEASTTTNHQMRTAVSYGTLTSVVSITPMAITVQSSPTVPTREPNFELPASVANKVTANAATMTSPPTFVAEPRAPVIEPPPASSAPVLDVREMKDSNEERRKKKSASSHPRQQLQLINCDISHLKNLEKMLKKHPRIVISSPVEHTAPSNHPSSRKGKAVDCPTSEGHMGHQHRSRHHNNTQDDRAEKQASIVKKATPPVSSADSRSTITSSILSSSSASASNYAPDYRACGAGSVPVTTSREITEEDERPQRPQRTERTQKSSRKHREPSPESEDSVTRAVTHAVSSRVKALRNLGQIEEAEVKIRVRMGQPSDAEGPPEKSCSRQIIDPTPKISISQARPSRREPVEELDEFDLKRAQLDEMIARHLLMDAEARKKLQCMNEMRENELRRIKDLKTKVVLQRDAYTLTSVDNATNTSPLNSATHVVSRSTQMKDTSVASSSSSGAESSSGQSCPACRVRASSIKPPENEPMCRHDPGFTAGQPRGRQRPPLAYFLKVKEDKVVCPETPPRMPSLQVVTVKVPHPVRPPSSIGSSGSSSSGSASSRHSPAQSPVRVKGHMASSAPAFGRDSRSSPESRRRRMPRKPARRDIATSRSEPQLGRGDADKYVAKESSDEQTATETLQDCLTNNFPEYIQAAERRRQCIYEMAYLRRLRQESRKRLVQLDGDAWVTRQKQTRSLKPSTAPAPAKPVPKPSARSMRLSTAKRYAKMPEMEQKRLELKKKEENRTNRLLKEIYTTKLREKALRGETTLRSSVSVISTF